MWGDESNNLAKSPDYIKRFKDVDHRNFAALDTTAGYTEGYKRKGKLFRESTRIVIIMVFEKCTKSLSNI